MALDRQDFEVLKQVRENTLKTVKEVRLASEAQHSHDAQMLDVFNRIAASLESIDAGIKALRCDLNPQLDKPAKPLSLSPEKK